MPDSWYSIDDVALDWDNPELDNLWYYFEAIRRALLERRGGRAQINLSYLQMSPAYLNLPIPKVYDIKTVMTDLDGMVEAMAMHCSQTYPPPPYQSGQGIQAYIRPSACIYPPPYIPPSSKVGNLCWYGQYTTNPAWTNLYVLNSKGLVKIEPSYLNADIKGWLQQKKIVLNELYLNVTYSFNYGVANFSWYSGYPPPLTCMVMWPRFPECPQCSTVKIIKGLNFPTEDITGTSPFYYNLLCPDGTPRYFLSFKCLGGFTYLD